MLICSMHKQQRQQRTKQRQFKTIWLVEVYKNKHAHANWDHHSKRMILYVAQQVNWVWNEGGVVPATCYLHLISRCVILSRSFTFSLANTIYFMNNLK
jgi:hypothetical protein